MSASTSSPSTALCGGTLLLRYSGEICTKARRTRARFIRRLQEGVEDALASVGASAPVDRQWSRLFVETEHPEAAEAVSRVFGVQSLSRTTVRPWDRLEDIVAAGAEIFAPRVRGRTFAVRARRTGGHAVPFSSPDLERALGTALLPGAAGVDLDEPEVTAHVEVHAGRAYHFEEKLPGPGGLPMGVEGRALALVSGGFDSAVAAWLMLKRGVALDYLFFNLGGAAHERGVLEVMRVIASRWSYGDRPTLFAVDLRHLVADLQEAVQPRYWQILLKLLMYRAAERLAAELGLPAIVTGEAVGQVSSQTLPNLAAITRHAEVPVLRPLLGFNKEEIIHRARRIGTHDLSAVVKEYCGLLPRYPVTNARVEVVGLEAEKMDFSALEPLLADRRAYDLREPDAAVDVPGAVEPADIPAGATLIDLRTPREFERWHYPGALCLEFSQALRAYGSLDRERVWVLYCEVGLKSAHLAEVMRAEGFEAYHVPAGATALRRGGTGEEADPQGLGAAARTSSVTRSS